MLMQLTDVSVRYNMGSILAPRYKTVIMKSSLSIDTNEIVGLIGVSGSGKSTIANILCGLIRPSSGSIELENKEISMPFDMYSRRQIQIVFQHPETVLDPKMKLGESVCEPYDIYHIPFSKEMMLDNLRQYGLYEEHLARYPNQLSGGEIQRACLARVLIQHPKLVILDEATSMLDLISQAQMIKLLREYKAKNRTSYLFITHDELLAEKFCSRIYQIKDKNIFLTNNY